jgi:outer membrane lipoprotein-sorting protein
LDSRLSYRCLRGLVIVIALMMIADLARAAEFSAETIIDQPGQKQRVTMYVKGQQLRVEMVDTFGQKQILISRPDNDQKTFMLYPETKTYMRLPAVEVQSPVGQNEAALKKIGKRRLVGQENIEGYLCDKYEITYYNKYLGKMIVWVARKLNYPIQMIQVGGPPDNSADRKLTNIKEHRVPDALFSVPDGYKQVKKPQGDCRAGLCRINFF